MKEKGLQIFIKNIKKLKENILGSFLRHEWPPKSDRSKSQTVFTNFFLHIQSPRIHKFSLKPWYTMGLGIMTFFLFVIATVTGLLLMIYYAPSTDLAYSSVKDIETVVAGGKLMRNMHRWSAHGMVLCVILHMIRVFYTGSYKNNRGFNWVIGILLLVITVGLSYTGYLLPWDQLAYWAVTIGANIAASPREITDALGLTQFFDIGGLQRLVLIGGTNIGQEALTRFYLLHVILLPLFCVTLIAVHFWRIRKDGGLTRPDNANEIINSEEGIVPNAETHRNGEFDVNTNKTYGLMLLTKDRSPQLDVGPDNTVMSWPSAIWAETAVFMITFAIMAILAYFIDAPLKELANPSLPENPAKAPWYFLGLQELVSYSAFMGGMGIPALVILGLMLIPFLDREKAYCGTWFSNANGKNITIQSAVFGTIFTVLLLAFTVKFGWLRNWFPDIPQLAIVIFNPGTVIVVVYSWWFLRTLQKSGSTRMAMIALFTCFIVGFIILTIMGLHFRGPNWDFYWSPSQWPAH